MEIKDIKANQGNIDLVLEVIRKEEARSFEKFGKKGRVCNAIVKDQSGQVKLTLWNEDIDKINTGDKIHLQNGWCTEYKGEKQLSTGKFGKIEIVSAGKTQMFTNDPAQLAAAGAAFGGDGDDDDDDADGEEESAPVDAEEYID